MNESELNSLHGLPLDAARRRVEASGMVFRIHMEDGVPHPGTADYRTDRVNVDVVSGKVASAALG